MRAVESKIPGFAELIEYCVENRIGRPGEYASEALLADHKRLVALLKDIRKDIAQARYLAAVALEQVDLTLEGTK